MNHKNNLRKIWNGIRGFTLMLPDRDQCRTV